MCSRIIPLFGFIISICSIVYLFKLRSDTKEDLFQIIILNLKNIINYIILIHY